MRLKPSLEDGHDSSDHVSHIFQRSKDGLSSDRVRLAERYIKGELYTLLTFTIAGDTTQYVAFVQARRIDHCAKGISAGGERENNFFGDIGGDRHEQSMLVRVIQSVEIPEIVAVPSIVWFHRIHECFSRWRHTLCFSFRFGYVLLGTLADREVDHFGIVSDASSQFGGQVIECVTCPRFLIH